MTWVGELRDAFGRLLEGERPRVGFAAPGTTIGEVGNEFNALVDDVQRLASGGWTREDAHSVRNRLAGILAAIHVLAETNELPAEEKELVKELQESAKALDASLRRR